MYTDQPHHITTHHSLPSVHVPLPTTNKIMEQVARLRYDKERKKFLKNTKFIVPINVFVRSIIKAP